MKCTDFKAIHVSQYGPTFGAGPDLHICDNSNKINSSKSNLGFSYKHPSYAGGSTQAQSFLAGSYHFQTMEIEVFSKE